MSLLIHPRCKSLAEMCMTDVWLRAGLRHPILNSMMATKASGFLANDFFARSFLPELCWIMRGVSGISMSQACRRLALVQSISYSFKARRNASKCGCGAVVAHHLAKVRVASSNLVIRSSGSSRSAGGSCPWWSGREARQRPAKPSTRVRIPSSPHQSVSVVN